MRVFIRLSAGTRGGKEMRKAEGKGSFFECIQRLAGSFQAVHHQLLLLICFAWASGSSADESPQLMVLGVAQDAGYPQIDCFEPRCIALWESAPMQSGASSLALVTADSRVLLFDAAPELPQQLYTLWQATGTRVADISGIFLTHAHMGHYLGLAYLGKEAISADRVPVYVMPRFKQFLETNGPWSQLVSEQNILLKTLTHNQPVDVADVQVKPLQVPHRDEYSETVGFLIDAGQRILYLPDIDKWRKWNVDLATMVQSVDLAFIDASFFGPGELPGRDMSLIPHPTVVESMDLLESLSREDKGKVHFIHMNHTNPMLRPNSPERQSVLDRGFRIAQPGQRIVLSRASDS